MSLAEAALGTVFSLLLCAFTIQGLQKDVEMVHCETAEAVVGQNITLHCVVQTNPDLNIVSFEWRKKMSIDLKLALISPSRGLNLFRPNVSVHVEKDNINQSMTSYLLLPEVEKWDDGVYVCDIATFPLGSIRREIELKVKDANITCDAGGRVDVRAGENVTIRCRAAPHAQYRWSKNQELVSESQSLQLMWVTDADAGVYTLTVNTGRRSLLREFNITVQTATPTDPTPVSPRSNLTDEGWQKPAVTSLSDANVTASTTVLMPSLTDVHPNGSRVNTTAGGHETHFTNSMHATAAPSTATPTDTYILLSSTTLTPSSASFSHETSTESSPHTGEPRDIFSVRPESSTSGIVTEKYDSAATTQTLTTGNEDPTRSHMVVWIIVPVLALTVVAGFLYRRHIIKQRMALPPPFKPPPPPVKYTAARHQVASTQPFPTARCNSVTELLVEDMNPVFIQR